MASGSIVIQSRLRGYWRLRLWTWLGRLLLTGVSLEWRVAGGEWRPLHVRLGLDVSVDPEEAV